MKEKALCLLMIVIFAISLSGCGKEIKSEEEVKTEVAAEDNKTESVIETKDKIDISDIVTREDMDPAELNSIIAENYKNVNKEELTYKLEDGYGYWYEGDKEIAYSDRLDEVPNINGKKYQYTLPEYTYAMHNPTEISYDKAMELVKSVLPDNIKEERQFINGDIYGPVIRHIVYSSSAGNFIVGIMHPRFEDENGPGEVDMDTVIGISYLKEY